MADFLELILNEEGRARLIKFFILNPSLKVSEDELKDKLQLDKRRIKKELDILLKAEIVKNRKSLNKFVYFLNRDNEFYPDLKKIVAKCTVFPQLKSLERLPKTGHVKLVLVTGVFANNLKTRSDILIVGESINKAKLLEVIKEIEAEIGKEIRYTSFTVTEYEYRLNMFDKFIREFFEGPHKVIFNLLGEKSIPNPTSKDKMNLIRR